MNYSTAVCLLSDKVRGIGVAYSFTSNQTGPNGTTRDIPEKLYTFKTLDPHIKIGDWVVVPKKATEGGYTVVKVFDVDAEIDIESNIQYNWIAGTFDENAYMAILENEQDMIRQLKDAERAHRRTEIADRMFANVPKEQLQQIGVFDGQARELPRATLSDSPYQQPPVPKADKPS